MSETLTFHAIQARQSDKHQVFTFAATAQEVLGMARIDRASRDDQGDLFGFQRPQVALHIHEIRDYLLKSDSVLPNSIVVAFVDSVDARRIHDNVYEIEIDISGGPHGLIVDGQQRLSALQPIADRDFQVFVSAIVCENSEELRRQFILINNTRPLPKELIYELLPTVTDLPQRLSSRAFAAQLTTGLNYWEGKNGERMALRGEIRQHTNPRGTISSNAIQRVIMNSRSNGILRNFTDDDAEIRSKRLIADFYGAVGDLFEEAWYGMSPRTSRLKHSAGIMAMGFAMETAVSAHGALSREQFADVLSCLAEEEVCAWTEGMWIFNSRESRLWDRLQNTPPDIRLLSDYLVRVVRDQGLPRDGFFAPKRSLRVTR
jgi:DGQHR domain-containing protein